MAVSPYPLEKRMIFKFTISGKEEQVVEFEKELLDILLRIVGDNEMIAHEIHFCVHEAILNVIQHTYKWNLELPLDIRIDVAKQVKQKRVLEISIKDYGPSIEKPITPPKQIEQFQLRKRGLYMISKIMDEFTIEPQEKSGNLTYMKKILSPKSDNVIESLI
jgi:anti-sigma regulatory factor (Ser/Thr protein kinase)